MTSPACYTAGRTKSSPKHCFLDCEHDAPPPHATVRVESGTAQDPVMRLIPICLAAAICATAPWTAAAEPRHAIAMQGDPALPSDYTHFDYANPDAPKGGEITYCVVGTFDNLNPFILKSLRTTARGMIDTIFGNLVFEPLMQR